jgi:hypothetical protein
MLKRTTLPTGMLVGLSLAAAGCPIVTDDDDSAVGDDDSAGDDDDTADDDDSAGDDDDSAEAPPPLELVSFSVSCDQSARAMSGSWHIELDFIGWTDQAVFFMWDGYTFQDEHYIDAHQPWAPEKGPYTEPPDPLGYTDNRYVDFDAWDTIQEAEDNSGTILDCYDDGGNPNVEVHNYMFCANDYWDLLSWDCWFCGEDVGGTATSNGDVGAWDDGTESYTWSIDYDCERTSTK